MSEILSKYRLTALDEKISSALSKRVSSDAVERLLAEARCALDAASRNAEAARERALDPTLTAREVADAREQADEHSFRRDRLAVAVARLEDRLLEVQKLEENERRWTAYNEAKKQRDALAAELKDTYPKLSAELTDLISRVASNDQRLDEVNRRLPIDARKLASAEAIAREIDSFHQGAVTIPRLTKALKIPTFENDPHARYVWPINSGSILD